MIDRRLVCLGTVSVFSVGVCAQAEAEISGVIAVADAIAALVIVVAKGTHALEGAVNRGDRLWQLITSVADRADAQRKLRAVRQQMVTGFSENGKLIILASDFNLAPNQYRWKMYLFALDKASSTLKTASEFLRENAAWFPRDAQDAFAEIPKISEKINAGVQGLRSSERPTTQDEIADFKTLMKAYDDLRVQSLKLSVVIRSYTDETRRRRPTTTQR
jgi:hypothetical protein